ncbi:MAG: hypothetical protein OXH57_09275, partial [Ekhidna sp.]|nr:hypothetical protein [Ekhidna sp.]
MLTVVMFSCSKEEDIVLDEPVPDGQVMLFDEEGYNPYLPENMELAFDSLKSKLYQSFPGARTTTETVALDFTPNKRYVRFLPADSVQLDTLMAFGDLALFDYPLDKPVVQQGAYTPEPANEAGYHWLYGVVPIDFEFPPVDHEVISDVFLPEYPDLTYDENLSGRTAYDSTEIYGMLMGVELYSMYLAGHLGDEEADELLALLEGEAPGGGSANNSPWSRFKDGLKSVRNTLGSIFIAPAYAKKANPLKWCWGCIVNSSWRPRGTVRVRDGNINQQLRGLKVVIHRGLKSVTAYTDNSGNFSSWSNFGSQVTYTVHWRNRSSKTFGTRYFRIVDRWYMTTAKHDIRRNTRSSVYHTYSLSGGRPTYEDAALAMIYLAAQHNYHRDILGLTRPRKNLRIRRRKEAGHTGQERSFNNHLLGSQIHIWITDNQGQYKTGRQLVATTFHELAHYTHFHEVKDWPFPANQWEWIRIDCGLKESWATCVEHYLTRATYYPDYTEGYHTREWTDITSEYTGIFIDIIDNDNQK